MIEFRDTLFELKSEFMKIYDVNNKLHDSILKKINELLEKTSTGDELLNKSGYSLDDGGSVLRDAHIKWLSQNTNSNDVDLLPYSILSSTTQDMYRFMAIQFTLEIFKDIYSAGIDAGKILSNN